MFTGEFEYRVDEKGRVPIPPKFRTDDLKKGGLVLTPGLEKCVTIYPLSEWKKVADSITSGPLAPSKLRKLNRAIFARAFNLELDGQGRIMVPLQLRQYAGIQEQVVITGANSYMELWSKELWDDERNSSQQEAWQIIESLERR
jgi:MraZ protein